LLGRPHEAVEFGHQLRQIVNFEVLAFGNPPFRLTLPEGRRKGFRR
jgi:hypothetical protein